MKRSIRDAIADAAINAVFQDYIDDVISLDELMSKLWQMHHPVAGKAPKDCNPAELNAIAHWHNERAEIMRREAEASLPTLNTASEVGPSQ